MTSVGRLANWKSKIRSLYRPICPKVEIAADTHEAAPAFRLGLEQTFVEIDINEYHPVGILSVGPNSGAIFVPYPSVAVQSDDAPDLPELAYVNRYGRFTQLSVEQLCLPYATIWEFLHGHDIKPRLAIERVSALGCPRRTLPQTSAQVAVTSTVLVYQSLAEKSKAIAQWPAS